MKRQLFLVLMTVGIAACDGSPLQPVAHDFEEFSGIEAAAGDMGSDPLYLEARSMLSDQAKEVGPDGRSSLSADDQILLAAIQLMETSVDKGAQR